MGKLLGIDVGKKNVGIAIAEIGSPIASPFGTFLRAQHRAESKILEILSSNAVEKIIVGLPLNESGKLTDQCKDVIDFTRRLKRRTDVDILYVDEHLSSCVAQDKLTEAGKMANMKKQKGNIDKAAAAIILQTFLDSEMNPKIMTHNEIEGLLSE
ncbi:MAG: Holliday junction resolvase RuvX [Bdellovibrionales bacterium]|nr:Holliday junction resolvase RuvX [Bdellovibrionales bacterium]